MNEPTDNRQDGTPPSRDATNAQMLLKTGTDVSTRVHEAIDTRTRAIAETWMAVVTLTYAVTFVLVSIGGATDGPVTRLAGLDIVFLLLAPFLVASMLEQGLRNQLRIVPTRKSRRHGRLFSSASAFALMVILWLALFSGPLPTLILVEIIVLAALPLSALAIRSARLARTGGVRRSAPTTLAPLSLTARAITIVLGASLGMLGAATGFSSSIAAPIASSLLLLAIASMQGSRWGLSRLAEEWGRAQWVAFGCSFVLINSLAVTFVRTDWDLAIVGFVGGICVATPLVIAAFRPAPIWEG